jgi:hypothetical protein
MKQFIAIAPIVSVKNLGSQMLRDYANSKYAFGSLMTVGPEIFAYATTDNIVKRKVVNTSMGS